MGFQAVEVKKRGRGRPRQFEENDALDKAITVFWAKGFDGTSLDDLAEAMGMGRPSMYNAFGDKEALFMRCLNRYVETVASCPLHSLQQESSVFTGMKLFFRQIAEYATCSTTHPGCLIGSVAAVINEPKVREFVAVSMDFSEKEVATRLQAAVDSGELPSNFPVQQRARRAIGSMMALGSRARLGTKPEALLADADDAADAVLA